MRHIQFCLLCLCALCAALLVSCNRDPEMAKRKYLENGNRYFSKAKYKEASIMYRNAIQKDPKFGEAYYRLALTEWSLGRTANAVRPLERAVELLDKNRPEYRDADLKLAEVYLMAAGEATTNAKQQQLLGEVQRISKEFLSRDENSYEGHKLQADVALLKATNAARVGDKDTARKTIETAISEYRRTIAQRPQETSVKLSLARALAFRGDYPESEKQYQSVITQDKVNATAYAELYRLYVMENKYPDGEATLKMAIANNPSRYDFQPLLAAYYYATNRQGDAAKVLNELQTHSNDYELAYLTAGDFYLNVANYDEAIRRYRQGMAATPKMKMQYQKRMIEALIRQGKRGDAARLNSEILKQDSKDPDARALVASMLLDSGQISKAVSELQDVVNATPNNFVARYHLGRAHAARGEWEQARQQFVEAIRQRQDYLPARVALGELQLSRAEYDASLQSAGEILALNPQSVSGRLLQASALNGLKKTTEARNVLVTLLKNRPDSAEAWFQLGGLNLSEGKYGEAEDSFRKSYQLNPSTIRPLVGIAQSYAARNRMADAIQVLSTESQKRPERLDLQMSLASFQARAGKYDPAIRDLQAALPKVEHSDRKTASELEFQIGEMYRQKGDLQNAIYWLRKAKESQPDNFAILANLALLMDAAGQPQEARPLYEESLRKEPDNPVMLNNLAFLMAQNGGDLDQALTLAQRAKQRLPESQEVSDTLGMIYLQKNLNDSALQIFRGLVKQQPNNATFRIHLALALLQKGDKLSAKRELQDALGARPQPSDTTKIKELMGKIS